MKVNGLMEKEKDSVFRSGLMDQDMSANGKTIKPMAKELSIMLMGMFIKENGLMTKPVVKEPILMKMVQNMLVNGRMTSKMVMVLSNGLMDKFTKVNIKMEQKLERVF